MEIKKIITHSGTFHADETSAIALLQIFGFMAPIERKFEITDTEINDPSVFILDVGRHYDPSNGNFDHHQNINSPSTNILIANWLTEQNLISAEVRENLSEFLNYVSDIDRGLIPEGSKPYTFNGIISSLNTGNNKEPELRQAFDAAILLAKQVMQAQLNVATRKVADKIRWYTLERICNDKIVINESLEHLTGWDKLAEADNVEFMIAPSNWGGWQIISRDATLFNIPTDNRQKFHHNSGFLATYETKQDAINHACEIAI